MSKPDVSADKPAKGRKNQFEKKKMELVKSIQLAVFLLIAAGALFTVFTNAELYQNVGRDDSIRTLCLLLWAALIAAFAFILVDFRTISAMKRDYRELDFVVHNDHIAGIANRYSCDAVIEKYADKPLPANVGCVMLELANIRDINQQFGHAAGNGMIQAFSVILNSSSLGLCFVGRNGGNKFMALFDNCDEVKINVFLTRLRQYDDLHNVESSQPKIEFRSGTAFNEGDDISVITQLIALADRRLTSQTDPLTGTANRNSCDEVIAPYLDKPLPREVGCIMINLANLQEINEARGHVEGNRVIRQFADILREASRDLCFAGRNGGTNFMVLFEKCDREKMDTFMKRVRERTDIHNGRTDSTPIRYTWGQAFEEGPEVTNINQLIALAGRRIRDNA